MRCALPMLLCSLAVAPLAAQVPAAEYAARRDSLAAAMQEGVLIALGGHEPTEDFLSFYPAPSFYYLTGVTEPDAVLVMVKRRGATSTMLFVQPRDPAREVWTGTRLGAEGMRRTTGIPSRTLSALDVTLDSLLGTAGTLQVAGDLSGDGYATRDKQFVDALHRDHPNLRIVDANELVANLRMRHSAAELALERKAIDITVRAEHDAISAIHAGVNEFEIQALIEYTFRRNGADRPAFSSIVGSGPNSTALHYNANDRFMQAGDVVVMDIGASYRGYAADVTRTVPVSGTFSPEQRSIYQIVRDTQHAAELIAKLGITESQMDEAANKVLGAGLAKLGLIEAPDGVYDAGSAGCRRPSAGGCSQLSLYYFHALGHAIGLEVHDPTSFRIQPGNTFTLEPGIYVRPTVLDELPDTPRNRAMIAKLRPAVQRYANIGVRIEDDYFATDAGVEWISRGPREASEIEQMMRVHAAVPAARDSSIVNWYRQTAPSTF
ncbi:MAG TPA: Xaa-Pro peptidase family protein [Gemmatimonadaceae bacterium]|nr:Xaa-Pro peptidase family protein [Gemmatimonadaceae bacterium]